MSLKPRLPFTKARKCCILCVCVCRVIITPTRKKRRRTSSERKNGIKKERKIESNNNNNNKKKNNEKKHAHFKRITDQNEWTKLANERKPMEEKPARNQKQEPNMQLRTKRTNKKKRQFHVYTTSVKATDRTKQKIANPKRSAPNKVGDGFHSNKTENFTYFQRMDSES